MYLYFISNIKTLCLALISGRLLQNWRNIWKHKCSCV